MLNIIYLTVTSSDNPDMPFNERHSYLVSIQKQFAKSKIKIVNVTEMSDISNLEWFSR